MFFNFIFYSLYISNTWLEFYSCFLYLINSLHVTATLNTMNRPFLVRNQNSEVSNGSQKSHSHFKPICEFVFPNSVVGDDEPKIVYSSSRTDFHLHSCRSQLTSASGSDAPIYLFSSSFTDRDLPFEATNKNSKLRHEMEGIESEKTKIVFFK